MFINNNSKSSMAFNHTLKHLSIPVNKVTEDIIAIKEKQHWYTVNIKKGKHDKNEEKLKVSITRWKLKCKTCIPIIPTALGAEITFCSKYLNSKGRITNHKSSL